MKILCLGAGYTSTYLALNFQDEHEVAFLSREPRKVESAGLRAFNPADNHRPDFILDTIPALFKGTAPEPPPYREYVEAILADAPATPIVHISSTSVYPEGTQSPRLEDLPHFDEQTPVGPAHDRGMRRLRWEEHLTSFYPGLRILRSGGIYGPGRSLALRFREGDFRRAESGNRVVSRIHVHDLARLSIAMALDTSNDRSSQMVIGVDGHSSSNRETFSFLEELLGITIPGNWREGDYLGRFMKSRLASDLLGGGFRFPDFRAGFRHSLTAST